MKVIFLGASNPETGRMMKAIERVHPNITFLGFIDNDLAKKGLSFLGYPVFGGFETLAQLIGEDVFFVNLITGSTKVRYETSRYMAQQGCRFTNFIHPSVDLTMTAFGVGNYIQEAVVVQAEVAVGNNSSIHIGTMVGHESKIGSSVFVAHACSISGKVNIGDGVFIGTNATILPRLKIGKWATIGAGTVVTKDVPDYAVVVGNPGKILRINEPVYTDGDIFGGNRL